MRWGRRRGAVAEVGERRSGRTCSRASTAMQSEPRVSGRVKSLPPPAAAPPAPTGEGAGPPLLKTAAAAAAAAAVAALPPPDAVTGIAPPSSTSPRPTGRATDARAAGETACTCRGAKTRRDARAARAAGAAPPAPRGSRRRQRRWSPRGADTGRPRPAATPDAAAAAPAGSGASGARSSAASCAAWTTEALNGTGGATEQWKRGGSASRLGSHRRAQSSANTAADVAGSSSASSPHVSRSEGRLRSCGRGEGVGCSQ